MCLFVSNNVPLPVQKECTISLKTGNMEKKLAVICPAISEYVEHF